MYTADLIEPFDVVPVAEKFWAANEVEGLRQESVRCALATRNSRQVACWRYASRPCSKDPHKRQQLGRKTLRLRLFRGNFSTLHASAKVVPRTSCFVVGISQNPTPLSGVVM